MIVRIDNYPHGDLLMYHRLVGSSNYDHREHVYNFLKPFEEKKVPYVLGVSPGLINNESDLFFLRSLRYGEIAMQGYSHAWHEFAQNWLNVTESLSQGGEFSILSRNIIRDKIKRGLDILSDFNICKFIAPFNVYTQSLLEVLNEFEFEMIMGGEETLRYGMDLLDHGNLTLDVSLPPFFNESRGVVCHLNEAFEQQKTITLQWIYEKPDNVVYWNQIAQTIRNIKGSSLNKNSQVHQNQRGQQLGALPHSETKFPVDLPVAVVTETMNYVSGGVRCIAEVLNRLKKRGIETACYVTQPDLRCEWLAVDFPILPVSQFQNFKGIAVSPYSPTAEIVARSSACGKFYWVHSYEPKFPELTGRSDDWRIMSENSYRFDQLQYFATSSYVKMILELIYHRDVIPTLVPGGVDTELFKPLKKTGDPVRIMFLSREHLFRGAYDVVKALEMVGDRIPELEIYVMGQPIEMANIAHKLVPPLPQRQFADLLGSVDIFIHASHFEGLPLPPLEAMSCNCAVIATDVGASDYLLNGYNALVVPPKKPEKIAAALLRLCKDADLRSKIGTGGFQTVSNGFTWEHTVDRLQEALSEGMNRRGLNNHTVPAVFEVSERESLISESGPGEDKLDDSNPPKADSYLVSAIVSTYNSERYIRGCLVDLLAQTIADQLQIVVVNSGSQQNEEAVVREFQTQFRNIQYIHTDRRESVYAAWNRGIMAAAGKYITNANTDDRHASHAFERLAGVLDERGDIALTYADQWITETENETFEQFTPVGRYKWQDFNRRILMEACYIGPQPMWRKTLHEKYGYFDKSFEVAGDWEFWLRICESETFLHFNEFLGLYLKSPQSVEHRHRQLLIEERRQIKQRYAQRVYGEFKPAVCGAKI